MYVKVEPTGVSEYRGMVQVRLAMFLEAGDHGYDGCKGKSPIIPAEGYKGKMKDGIPEDIDDFKKWYAELPTKTVDVPFHNHFIYVDPGASDDEIMDKAEELLKASYAKWQGDEPPHLFNNSKINFPGIVSSARKAAVAAKVQSLKDSALERKVERKAERKAAVAAKVQSLKDSALERKVERKAERKA